MFQLSNYQRHTILKIKWESVLIDAVKTGILLTSNFTSSKIQKYSACV